MHQISVSRHFSAAHAIRLRDGTLEPQHRHDWSVLVTVETAKLDQLETVMDFHVLEKAVDALLGRVSERTLNDCPPFAARGGKLAISPTAERVAEWLGTALARELPRGVRVVSVAVGEAPGCTATFRPDV